MLIWQLQTLFKQTNAMLTDEQMTEHCSQHQHTCLNTNKLNINILHLGIYTYSCVSTIRPCNQKPLSMRDQDDHACTQRHYPCTNMTHVYAIHKSKIKKHTYTHYKIKHPRMRVDGEALAMETRFRKPFPFKKWPKGGEFLHSAPLAIRNRVLFQIWVLLAKHSPDLATGIANLQYYGNCNFLLEKRTAIAKLAPDFSTEIAIVQWYGNCYFFRE